MGNMKLAYTGQNTWSWKRTNKEKKSIYEKVKRSLNIYWLGSLDVLSFGLSLEKAYSHHAFKLEGVNVD